MSTGTFTKAIALLAALLPASAFAAEPASVRLGPDTTLTFDGQYRPRYMLHSGLDLSGGKLTDTDRVTHRARLGVTLARDNGASFTLRLQDVRIWGEESDTLNDLSAGGLDVHEAFATIPLSCCLSLKLGRQEMSFDTQRIIGAVGWSQRGRSFDAARLHVGKGKTNADLFGAILTEDDGDADGTWAGSATSSFMVGAHGSWQYDPQHNLSLLALSVNQSDPTDARHTVGLVASGKTGGFSYTGEGYYQLGKTGGKEVSAWLVAVRPSFTVDAPWKPSVTLWGEALSGEGTDEGTFNTLFATNHKFYGEMDFFLATVANTGKLGLVDAGGRIACKPMPNLGLHVDVHQLMAMEPDPNDSRSFGTEIDVKLVAKVHENVSVRALYGIMLSGDALGTVKGTGPSPEKEQLAYLTVDTTF